MRASRSKRASRREVVSRVIPAIEPSSSCVSVMAKRAGAERSRGRAHSIRVFARRGGRVLEGQATCRDERLLILCCGFIGAVLAYLRVTVHEFQKCGLGNALQ